MSDYHRSESKWTLTIVALVGALAIGLPFLNKPFHIDDTVVLAVAKQITEDPLHPYSMDFHWFADPEPIFETTTNPPFLSYWLAPIYRLFGPSEIALHVAMLPFLIILGLSAASLSRRFAQGSVWPVLFVLFSPAVVVSTNIMRDVPAAALATGAVAMFVAGTDRKHWGLALCGGLLAGLAMVTKYSVIILLPVLLVYPVLHKKYLFLLGLLPALLVLGLWYLQNYIVHEQIHFFYLMGKQNETHVDKLNKITATFVITGASFFLVPGLLAGAARRRDGATPGGATIVALLAALLFVAYAIPRVGPQIDENTIRYHFWELLQYELWAILGSVLLYWLIVAGLVKTDRWWKRAADGGSTDSLFLLWWIIGPYLTSAYFVQFPAVRHVLPAVAPVALLAVRYTQRPTDAPPGRWVGAAFGVALLAQAIIAFWTAAADYQYADTYRQFAREAAEKYKPPEGNEIWFHGHWGWQHYCTEAGFRQIAEHGKTEEGTAPKPGDIVLEPFYCHRMGMPAGLRKKLEKIDEKTYPARLGVTTMDWGYAGFYATFGTTCPQRFAKGRFYERFTVYRVKENSQ